MIDTYCWRKILAFFSTYLPHGRRLNVRYFNQRYDSPNNNINDCKINLLASHETAWSQCWPLTRYLRGFPRHIVTTTSASIDVIRYSLKITVVKTVFRNSVKVRFSRALWWPGKNEFTLINFFYKRILFILHGNGCDQNFK